MISYLFKAQPVVTDHDFSFNLFIFFLNGKPLVTDEIIHMTCPGINKPLVTDEIIHMTCPGINKPLVTDEIIHMTCPGINKPLVTDEIIDMTCPGIQICFKIIIIWNYPQKKCLFDICNLNYAM